MNNDKPADAANDGGYFTSEGCELVEVREEDTKPGTAIASTSARNTAAKSRRATARPRMPERPMRGDHDNSDTRGTQPKRFFRHNSRSLGFVRRGVLGCRGAPCPEG